MAFSCLVMVSATQDIAVDGESYLLDPKEASL